MKPTRAGQANVELLIEELVLDGLPYDQRHRVATALEGEIDEILGFGFWEDLLPQFTWGNASTATIPASNRHQYQSAFVRIVTIG